MKITFYSAVMICLIQSFFWLFFPFGGFVTVMNLIKGGLFGGAVQTEMIGKNVEHLSGMPQFFSSAFTFLYFLSIFACSLLPLGYKLKANTKYKIGVILATLSIIILFAAKIINTYIF
ncbi:hypothetical protein [Pedobacter sp. Hv1]|uniref:hypothetical protein n=1 Tax=Pedobacter sp. Hv1 TaxID=1740090 RepID=UPI0006D8A015|nr:hypothetical protein [Pedobacter sp. Hv1]KQC01812.1 hypothetical protein AQF98_05455 [Pedobacter sp. Hv1]